MHVGIQMCLPQHPAVRPPPDLGYSSAPRLLTTIKLTGADVTVLHFHTVQCLRRGHVEGWRGETTGGGKKIRISSEKVGVGGEARVPSSDWTNTRRQRWLITAVPFLPNSASSMPFTRTFPFFTFKISALYSEIPSPSLSLCFSYRYLCRRGSNTDFVWQLSVQGLDSNWSTNRKHKKEMVGWGRERRQISPSLPPCVALNENPNARKRFSGGQAGCGSPERFVFVEMRCQKRQDFLGAQHNMSPSLIISHSQTWFALNALMLKEPHRLEASRRWNHGTHPWQTAIHHARIKQSLHIPPPKKK